jgi:hypothetical protein
MSVKKPLTLISGIRLSQAEKSALGKAMGIHAGAERRRHIRYLLPKEFPLVVSIQREGSVPALFSVTPRDLSATGLGFFHAAYIHPGTPCILMMRSLCGEPVSIKGRIIRCRHVSGRIHEVGALFDQEITVEQFVEDLDTAAPDVALAANLTLDDLRLRLSILADELKQLADNRAERSELLAKVGELALLVAPSEPSRRAPGPPPPPPPSAPTASTSP